MMGTASARSQPRHPGAGGRNTRDVRQIARWLIMALAAAWLIAFIVSNSEQVKVSFVFGDVTLSLVWVMTICAVVGALLAVAIPRRPRRRRS